MSEIKPKSFWKKPEGVTGGIFITAFILGLGYVLATSLGTVVALVSSGIGSIISLLVLGAVIYMAIDNKSRSLVSYLFKSFSRWITGLFIQIDPISILKGYVDELKSNLKSMRKQIYKLRSQKHKLKEMIVNNQKEIENNLSQANNAKRTNEEAQMILKSRKAGRLQQSNVKLDELYRKMEILDRVLNKMYQNSAILAEDIEDQVTIKETERKAILASHSAMKSAMNVIRGDKDKKEMFDTALEAIADDVSNKVGEMENFMSLSENFMQSIDLQNGVFEEEGLKMLEKWEQEGVSILLGNEKSKIIKETKEEEIMELESPEIREPEKIGRSNQYDQFFN
jgi:phage shock protein A